MRVCVTEGCNNAFVGPASKKYCSVECRKTERYRLRNIKRRTDEYREKERLRRKTKEYLLKRKERYRSEEYRIKNKERQRKLRQTKEWKEYAKRYRESKKLDYWIVYELEGGHIGQTNQPEHRKRGHRVKGRNMDNYETLAVCYTREEALDLEALYQSLSNNYNKTDSLRLKQK